MISDHQIAAFQVTYHRWTLGCVVATFLYGAAAVNAQGAAGSSAVARPGTEEMLLADAVLAQVRALIDSQRADLLCDAFSLLQALLQRDPGEAGAYLDLARIAMKTNGGPEGLQQAETLIVKGTELRPGSVDARILLGSCTRMVRRSVVCALPGSPARRQGSCRRDPQGVAWGSLRRVSSTSL
ncbi:MAG: tetratricopeptide repeat protein [Ramlibacter sp.]